MKFNPDLFRNLLLSIEDITDGKTLFPLYIFGDDERLINCSKSDIYYHASLMEKNGLIKARPNNDYDFFYITDLTLSGHQYLNDIRNVAASNKIKEDE